MAEQATRHELAPAATRSISRRQLVKAGAWSVPVVVATVAVPSAVASPFTLEITAFNAVVGRGAAHRGYGLQATVKNNSTTTAATISVVFGLANEPTGNQGNPAVWTGKNQSREIGPGSSWEFTATFNAGGGNAVPTNATVTASANGFTGDSAEDSNFTV